MKVPVSVFKVSVFEAFVTVAFFVAFVTVVYYLRNMSQWLWWSADRADKASNKLEAMELRQMLTGLRCHELIRHLLMSFDEFQPAADRTWLLRRLSDLVSQFVEVRVRDVGIAVAQDSLVLVRFCLRTVRERLLMGNDDQGLLLFRRLAEFEANESTRTGARCRL